ncbi:unnamed protein product, partial [Mesorhabditis belari]|uniref:Uncharacterized protein n=1 Tax=Mesorhabditis belari TaxID=2138241 RepID=A0AAF3EHZ8_9BILA
MSNIFSASASWLAVAVSFERFSGIRSPMHARLQWGNSRVLLSIILILFGAIGVSFYHFLEHTYEYHPDIGKMPRPKARTESDANSGGNYHLSHLHTFSLMLTICVGFG